MPEILVYDSGSKKWHPWPKTKATPRELESQIWKPFIKTKWCAYDVQPEIKATGGSFIETAFSIL